MAGAPGGSCSAVARLEETTVNNDRSSVPASNRIARAPADPRVQALETAFARSRLDGGADLPPALAAAVLADIRERLAGGEAGVGGLPGGGSAEMVALENVEAECLALLVDAGLLDHDTLHAVHG